MRNMNNATREARSFSRRSLFVTHSQTLLVDPQWQASCDFRLDRHIRKQGIFFNYREHIITLKTFHKHYYWIVVEVAQW